MVALHHWCFYRIPFSSAQAENSAVAPLMHIVYGGGMSDESDPIIRKSVSARTSLWERIDDWQRANRIKRDAEAIRRLLVLGLAAAGGDGKPQTYDVGPARKERTK